MSSTSSILFQPVRMRLLLTVAAVAAPLTPELFYAAKHLVRSCHAPSPLFACPQTRPCGVKSPYKKPRRTGPRYVGNGWRGSPRRSNNAARHVFRALKVSGSIGRTVASRHRGYLQIRASTRGPHGKRIDRPHPGRARGRGAPDHRTVRDHLVFVRLSRLQEEIGHRPALRRGGCGSQVAVNRHVNGNRDRKAPKPIVLERFEPAGACPPGNAAVQRGRLSLLCIASARRSALASLALRCASGRSGNTPNSRR